MEHPGEIHSLKVPTDPATRAIHGGMNNNHEAKGAKGRLLTPPQGRNASYPAQASPRHPTHPAHVS